MEYRLIPIELYKRIKGKLAVGRKWKTVMAHAVPRVGEQIRVDSDKVFLVKRVYHDFDSRGVHGCPEPHCIFMTIEEVKF